MKKILLIFLILSNNLFAQDIRIIPYKEAGAFEYKNLFRHMDGFLNIHGWSNDGLIFYSTQTHINYYFKIYNLITNTPVYDSDFPYTIRYNNYDPTHVIDYVSSTYHIEPANNNRVENFPIEIGGRYFEIMIRDITEERNQKDYIDEMYIEIFLKKSENEIKVNEVIIPRKGAGLPDINDLRFYYIRNNIIINIITIIIEIPTEYGGDVDISLNEYELIGFDLNRVQ
ncbi:hypothetical protein AGMMS49579_22720 [Spirochaetia bacterium]|nr:hypothetical protein AGMMS49579_22720 [Spirochaetia bacterium]